LSGGDRLPACEIYVVRHGNGPLGCGAVAFSRTGDPATGDFRDATVIRKFRNVPDNLSAL
jgi:hypothetical protein